MGYSNPQGGLVKLASLVCVEALDAGIQQAGIQQAVEQPGQVDRQDLLGQHVGAGRRSCHVVLQFQAVGNAEAIVAKGKNKVSGYSTNAIKPYFK